MSHPQSIELPEKLDTRIGFFRFKKFDSETYLITNDVGEYCFLAKKDFNKFIGNTLTSGPLFEELLQKSFIKDDFHVSKMTRAYAEKNRFLSYGPTLHIVVTTLRCNHKCQYCHAAAAPMSAKQMDMSLETAKKTLDTILYTSAPALTIEFQGGESLANWDVVKFFVTEARVRWEHLGKDITLALVTNLTLMDEEKMNFLLDNNVHISTSLDGDEEVHNYNRVHHEGNSFEKTTYWIRKINEEYKRRDVKNRDGKYQKVWALLTVTKKTLPKYKEVIDTYISLGLDGIFLRSLNPYGFASVEIENLWYTLEEFIEFYKKSMEYILELNKKGIQFREQFSSIYLMKILTPKDPNFLDERSPCGACIGQVAYNYDGKIYSCDEGRMLGRMGIEDFLMTEVSNSPKDTYQEMIESDTTKIMVQASTLDGLPGYNDDVYKPYIGVCPIHSYKTTGNIYPNYALDKKRKLGSTILDYLFENLRDPEIKEIFTQWIWASKKEVMSQCDAT